MKTAERQRARELRALGWSIKEIERELGVSRSSASLWVRDVPLGSAAQRRLAGRVGGGPRVAAFLAWAKARARRAGYQIDGRRLAHERGAAYAAGCMLYWAEGAKARNSVRLINSDPELLTYFIRFLRREFTVPDEKFRVCCNLFADHLERQIEIEDYWLARLELPRSRLGKTVVNAHSKYSQKKRQNRLPYGTTALVVNSSQIQQTILGSIQELGGFDRPEWLD